jgi:hypothetical protein
MKKSGLLILSGTLLLVVGLLFVIFFGWDLYTEVYDCEHLTGAVPVGGCEAFLQLPSLSLVRILNPFFGHPAGGRWRRPDFLLDDLPLALKREEKSPANWTEP